eukprot:CAMPEP_0175223660 /NCGR_PEP_ID=MMETSP0093-20121207/21447_1 /TAXON_ID=311494 /ORGANISM="Alexandrium monilatum, Strain CCMP3105" /LENGTH=330 /DNA_ID=CAMNT_0016517271 /DNA_START=13 /DNA_END=1003 /DNA_ORIENTATION=-
MTRNSPVGDQAAPSGLPVIFQDKHRRLPLQWTAPSWHSQAAACRSWQARGRPNCSPPAAPCHKPRGSPAALPLPHAPIAPGGRAVVAEPGGHAVAALVEAAAPLAPAPLLRGARPAVIRVPAALAPAAAAAAWGRRPPAAEVAAGAGGPVLAAALAPVVSAGRRAAAGVPPRAVGRQAVGGGRLAQLCLAVGETALVAGAALPLLVPYAERLLEKEVGGPELGLPVREAAIRPRAPALREGDAKPRLSEVRRGLHLLRGVREGALGAELALAPLEVLAHLGLAELLPEAGPLRRLLVIVAVVRRGASSHRGPTATDGRGRRGRAVRATAA